jgi:hypothetical protein
MFFFRCWQKQKQAQGLLPVSGLNNPKTDGRDRGIPCHADQVVVESRVPCTLTYNHKRTKADPRLQKI